MPEKSNNNNKVAIWTLVKKGQKTCYDNSKIAIWALVKMIAEDIIIPRNHTQMSLRTHSTLDKGVG